MTPPFPQTAGGLRTSWAQGFGFGVFRVLVSGRVNLGGFLVVTI